MTMQDITNYLDEKIAKNENEIIITFYEIRIAKDLSEAQTNTFLSYCKTRLENLGYQVFITGDKIQYGNIERIVQDNELMIAIKK